MSGEKELEEAKKYWTQTEVLSWYWEKTPLTEFIVAKVGELDVSSVFEFGCGTGRTLHYLEEAYLGITCVGVDVNPRMVEIGRDKFKVEIYQGDESFMESWLHRHASMCGGESAGMHKFDLVFSCSALDHSPKPLRILRAMFALAKKYVLLVEPWCEREGRVDPELTKTPYTYSWNYDLYLDALGHPSLESKPIPLKGTGMAPYYRYWLVKV